MTLDARRSAGDAYADGVSETIPSQPKGPGAADVTPSAPSDWEVAAAMLHRGRFLVLTGAGISTDSGIPDYRGEKTRRLARDPVRFSTFVRDAEARRRYWARAMAGWPRMRDARPNPAHRALARLETEGRISGIVTQNVDRLHQRAGSRRVIELHGALHEVACLGCGHGIDRDALQLELERRNPELAPQGSKASPSADAPINPDGDAELPEALSARFRVVDCARCGGALKPRVVYFGESVPPNRVERAYALVDAADALLVLGSSLAVFSGYRFVRRAAARDIPVVIVNRGPTRGDPLARLKIDASLSAFVPWLAGARAAAPRPA